MSTKYYLLHRVFLHSSPPLVPTFCYSVRQCIFTNIQILPPSEFIGMFISTTEFRIKIVYFRYILTNFNISRFQIETNDGLQRVSFENNLIYMTLLVTLPIFNFLERLVIMDIYILKMGTMKNCCFFVFYYSFSQCQYNLMLLCLFLHMLFT